MSVISDRQHQTRNLLVAAATAVFHERGYQKARVSDIVAKAGVAQGTCYLYFRSKEAVFRHICETYMERFTQAFQQSRNLFEGGSEAEVRETVSEFIQRLLRVYEENRAVAELLFREGIGHGGLFKEIYEDLFVHFLSLIRERIQDSISRGIFRFDDAETAAVFVLGLFERGVFYFLLLRQELDVEKLAGRMADFLLGGLDVNVPGRRAFSGGA
jgi:AcrR family transcriptional regulator